MATVQPGSFLTLHYRLAGPQGDIINTFLEKPATLSLGSGELTPAMEQRLLGLQEGTRTVMELPAGEAFGDHNPDMQQWVARKLLNELGDPMEKYAAGDVVQFPTPDGLGAYAGTVLQVGDEGAVLFDFNHPLAGQPVTFEHALAKFGRPIYVRHEIVHNTYVVNDLKAKGAIFIEELSEVPPGATLIFSAHGVSLAVQQEAERRGFRIFDATCPLVSKVHVELAKLHKEGYEFLMIGHKGHPEVEGTMGQLDSGIHLVEDVADVAKVQPSQTEKLAVVTQTTLSVDDAAEIVAAVIARFPQVRRPKQQDICYATQNRQDAVKLLSPQVDVVIVVGSPTSSNSNRLSELANRLGTPAYMVDSAAELQPHWLDKAQKVGLTAGASAPDVLVQEVIARLRELGMVSVRTLDGIQEHIKFPLPKGLKLD
eukprot:gene4415-4321_t